MYKDGLIPGYKLDKTSWVGMGCVKMFGNEVGAGKEERVVCVGTRGRSVILGGLWCKGWRYIEDEMVVAEGQYEEKNNEGSRGGK